MTLTPYHAAFMSVVLFDVLFLMALPAIFILFSWCRTCSGLNVRYVRPGRKALRKLGLSGRTAWIGRLGLNEAALEASTFECL